MKIDFNRMSADRMIVVSELHHDYSKALDSSYPIRSERRTLKPVIEVIC